MKERERRKLQLSRKCESDDDSCCCSGQKYGHMWAGCHNSQFSIVACHIVIIKFILNAGFVVVVQFFAVVVTIAKSNLFASDIIAQATHGRKYLLLLIALPTYFCCCINVNLLVFAIWLSWCVHVMASRKWRFGFWCVFFAFLLWVDPLFLTV